MRVPGSSAVAVLESLSSTARHHFDFRPAERQHLAALWLRQFVRLQPGDVWSLSDQGRRLLARITLLIDAEPTGAAERTARAGQKPTTRQATVVSLAARRAAMTLKTPACHRGS